MYQLRLAYLGACLVAVFSVNPVAAQTAVEPPATPTAAPPDPNVQLPAIVVESGQTTSKKKAKKAPSSNGAAAQSSIPTPGPSQQPQSETAYGPVDGYVATRSATGTKTDAPL